MANLFRFVIMGPPGSGKGTISSRIVKRFNLPYLASGDILRNEIAGKTAKGIECKTYIEKGQLVPDELVTNLIFEKLGSLSKSNFLLDGFPRTVQQADDLLVKCSVTLALNLAVPDDVIVDRLTKRWIHPGSGRIYSTDFNPPKIAGLDDLTGEKLVQREDDKPHIVMARLEAYRRENDPVLNHFRKRNILKEFAGRESNEIWPKVEECLKKYF